jgi:uncharacterized LabA/DUF88 family protein
VKVALFFDGKNFYSGWKREAAGVTLDFDALAGWLVDRVDGSRLFGAHYYTGVEEGGASEGARGLERFLDQLEHRRGFFVRRFARREREHRCEHCGEAVRSTQEKEVDTTIVADMLRLAAVDAFDVAVLISGDADLAPAVEGVRALGKQAIVATWRGHGLSSRLRRAAYDHVDLADGLAVFQRSAEGGASDETAPAPERDAGDDAEVTDVLALGAGADAPAIDEPEDAAGAGERKILEALAAAERHFGAGYVGRFYFVMRWRFPDLDENPGVRNRLLEALLERGEIEAYRGPDGSHAIRRRRS